MHKVMVVKAAVSSDDGAAAFWGIAGFAEA